MDVGSRVGNVRADIGFGAVQKTEEILICLVQVDESLPPAMIFSVVRELHRLTIQTVLCMACNRRLRFVKKSFMASAL